MRLSAAAIAGAMAFAFAIGGTADRAVAKAHFLTAEQTEPSVLLPPPPAQDSDEAKIELKELDRIQAEMTQDQFARATLDNDNENGTMFATVLGPSFDLAKLPATAKLLEDVRAEESAAAKQAKTYFKRLRPYAVDAALKTCEKSDADPHNSYPSGHATMGYAMAVILASLMPSKAQLILARAADYAHERLICGVHYRSDIVAGQVLGTAVALDLLQNKDFRAEYDAAAAELRALP